MIQTIKINIDIKNKQIKNLDFPKELNPIEITMILMEVQKMILSKIKLEKKEDTIIKPKLIIPRG